MKNDERIKRRTVLASGLVAGLPLISRAQANWPDKPIKLVVPFVPGGSNDNIARVLASKLGPRLGQTVVIENKGGSGGTIGTDFVVKSAPDGYTLLLASGSIISNAAFGKKLPYDPLKDLQPISMIGTGPYAVVVSNQLKVTTLREFFELARAKPGQISYGSAGIGGLNHLGTELLASTAKVQLMHVPYKGIGPAFSDLIAGNLQMLLPTIAASLQHIRSGSMRGLAITSAQRSPLAPELPTVSEAGLPGFQLEVWWGLLGPAKLPQPIIQRLNTELAAVLALPDVRDLLAREGALPQPSTPEVFGSVLRADLTRWTKLIKDANIQAE